MSTHQTKEAVVLDVLTTFDLMIPFLDLLRGDTAPERDYWFTLFGGHTRAKADVPPLDRAHWYDFLEGLTEVRPDLGELRRYVDEGDAVHKLFIASLEAATDAERNALREQALNQDAAHPFMECARLAISADDGFKAVLRFVQKYRDVEKGYPSPAQGMIERLRTERQAREIWAVVVERRTDAVNWPTATSHRA